MTAQVRFAYDTEETRMIAPRVASSAATLHEREKKVPR